MKIIKCVFVLSLVLGISSIVSALPIAHAYVACSGTFVPSSASFPKDVLFQISGDPCTGAQGVGAGALKQPIGQTFNNSDVIAGNIYGVEISLSKEGNPTDDIVVSLRADILGADLTSASVSTASLAPHASYSTLQLLFNQPIPTDNARFLIVRRTGILDITNFVDLRHADPGSYPNGGYFECGGASCPVTPSYDVVFKLLGEKKTRHHLQRLFPHRHQPQYLHRHHNLI